MNGEAARPTEPASWVPWYGTRQKLQRRTTAREFYAESPREIRLRLIAEEEAGIDSDVGQTDSH